MSDFGLTRAGTTTTAVTTAAVNDFGLVQAGTTAATTGGMRVCIENTGHTGDVSDEGSKRASVYDTFSEYFYPTGCLGS